MNTSDGAIRCLIPGLCNLQSYKKFAALTDAHIHLSIMTGSHIVDIPPNGGTYYSCPLD